MNRQTVMEFDAMAQDLDSLRLVVSPQLSDAQKAELGQFLTPKSIATFMASLFSARRLADMRLLDPGAGIGSLAIALLERRRTAGHDRVQATVTAYEIDASLRTHLSETLGAYHTLAPALVVDVRPDDFIEESTRLLHGGTPGAFTHAILNPPYRKIHSGSAHRLMLRSVGIETVNLYTAFVALTVLRMEHGGEVVAIIPRSFCNGVYYRPFREFLLARTAVEHIHLFESRTSAFSDDDVLQENIIVKLVVGKRQGRVTVSTSHDARLRDAHTARYPFDEIVSPTDVERFIHIPTMACKEGGGEPTLATHTLVELGIEVSTGPVVDFRLREYLRDVPNETSVPLLYPGNFVKGNLLWPRLEGRKPNAIERTAATEKWLYPNGWYTVVRRFSSKEERRRVVAYVVPPSAFTETALGFENHLNVFHAKRAGLDEDLVRGLSVYLNATSVDTYFRRFSGHTQVNATDLRNLRYPSLATLRALGAWARKQGELSQEVIDEKLTNYGS